MALAEHLEKLRHFQRVTGFKSIREAAQAIGISQAGLSKSIASLESVLETRLFIRSNEGLTLTKEGAEVLKASERILEEAAQVEFKLRSLKASSTPKRLRIGMYDSIAVYFFAELNTYLKSLYPTVVMELVVESSSSLWQKISSGHLDLAIGVNLDRQRNNKAEFYKLFEDHYSFYISSRAQTDTNLFPLIIYPDATDSEGMSVEKHLSSLIKVRGAHRVLNFETLKTLTLQNFGIGVMPTQVARPLLSRDLLTPIQIAKTRLHFGTHTIGLLATEKLLRSHRDFAEDIYRLGQRWSK